ncbi:MAG: exodeoxyribonuclease VII large subunit, partial [Pseudomonadales bacterium]|nr:exodeoxyribonuclease VII large subunit [Pseudomonadales bacterium]
MDTKIYSVGELNRLARNTLEKSFSGIAVEGEISDLIQHRSGHWYFTLKDKDAQLRVAMFRSSNARVRFEVENGLQVLLKGRAS